MSKKNDTSNYDEFTKEELVAKIKQMEQHVTQLKNVISKSGEKGTNVNHKRKKQKPFDFNKYNTRHVALRLAYLGWDYQGFAVQEDTSNTIEAVLFDALIKTKLIESRETSCYHRCGRTDKGVSAFGQVISIDLRSNLLEGVGVKIREGGTAHSRPGDKTEEIDYVHILNKVLPAEIRVHGWTPVQEDFSARFSCIERTYKYYFPKSDLDIEKMEKAGSHLIGEHDFRNLCKMDVANGVVNFMRKILSVSITSRDDCDLGYQMCELTIVGQAFLWHQIRCIVAVLMLVGKGHEETDIIRELLDVEKHPRKPQYTMASELPLVLYDCKYENIEWIYCNDWQTDNIKHLQEMWTKNMVKATIVRQMLCDLQHTQTSDTKITLSDPTEAGHSILNQTDCLLPGNKPRTYKPLLERNLCESLEDRIQHYAKRRKTEL